MIKYNCNLNVFIEQAICDVCKSKMFAMIKEAQAITFKCKNDNCKHEERILIDSNYPISMITEMEVELENAVASSENKIIYTATTVEEESV